MISVEKPTAWSTPTSLQWYVAITANKLGDSDCDAMSLFCAVLVQLMGIILILDVSTLKGQFKAFNNFHC